MITLGTIDSHGRQGNIEGLPEIKRQIVSAVIFSSDGCLLMGRKDPAKGGVYPTAWHIPGGGIMKDETLKDALVRELHEEVRLRLTKNQLVALPFIGQGETVKTVDGKRVWCKMKFHRFEVRLDKTAAELASEVIPGDDLVELRWFCNDELENTELIPGGKDFFIQAGYIQT